MSKSTAPKKDAPVTGTYRFDRETGEVVLVSEGIPKVASKGRSAAKSSPCGEGACEPRGGGMGGGCCGGGACG